MIRIMLILIPVISFSTEIDIKNMKFKIVETNKQKIELLKVENACVEHSKKIEEIKECKEKTKEIFLKEKLDFIKNTKEERQLNKKKEI